MSSNCDLWNIINIQSTMSYRIKEGDKRESERTGFRITTVQLGDLVTKYSGNSLVGLSFLDQKVLSSCNPSRISISHINLVIILISQAKINTKFDSFWIDLSSSFLILCHEKVFYQINRFFIFNYKLGSLLHIFMYVYLYPMN